MKSLIRHTSRRYRDAYAGHPREIWILGILTFINRLGMMVLPFLTVYLNTVLGFSLKTAGLLAGAYGLGSLCGAYLGGKLSDRFGPNPVIIMSLMVSGILLICLQFAMAFYSLFGLIFITALFGEAYRPALMVSVGNYVPKSETGRSVSLLRLAVNLGMSASPAIGGFVAATLGYSWLFWIDGLTCIAGASYFLVASRHWQKHSELKKAEAKAQESEAAIPPYKNRTYLLYLLGSFVLGVAFVQWFHSVPVFIKSEWGFDERYIGILMASSSLLITLIEMPAIHSIELAQKKQLWLRIGMALIGLSFLPFLFPGALIWCFLGMFVMTMGEIFFFPFNNSIALNMSPDVKRGEYMAWYWMAWSLTGIVGPGFGLWMAGEFGFPALWLTVTALAGLGLWINTRTQNRET